MIMLAALALAAAGAELPDVYVLAGQSNMSGRGALSDLSESERRADPAIRLYGNDGAWRAALDPLDSALAQIDAVSADHAAAVGPGLFFARAMRAPSTRPIVLVPCAKGGSSIAAWKPGGGSDTLYGSCLARVRAAGGRLAGILWYQGESDAERSIERAAGWTPAFVDLVAAFRRDLGVARLPVVYVGLADRPAPLPKYPAWEAIQQQQATPLMACTQTVSAQGLATNPDRLHLSTAGQRTLGPLLAQAMRGLIRRGCH